MANLATQSLGVAHAHEQARQLAILVGASLFVALCAHITLPLPFTPVPLTLQNFAVLLVGLRLGSRRGFAALVLYLAEGAAGLPVFNPTGPGGLLQLFGPTGGYLMVYPVVAGLAGLIMERGEVALFAGGLGWLALLTHSFLQAFRLGLYWFVFAEVIKIMAAAAIAARLRPSLHRDNSQVKA